MLIKALANIWNSCDIQGTGSSGGHLKKIFFYSSSTNRGTASSQQKFCATSPTKKDSQLSAAISVPSKTRTEKVVFFLNAR